MEHIMIIEHSHVAVTLGPKGQGRSARWVGVGWAVWGPVSNVYIPDANVMYTVYTHFDTCLH